jgi:molecular chaperone GrpE
MTNGREPGDNSEDRRTVESAAGQVEGAAGADPAPAAGEKGVPETRKSPGDAEGGADVSEDLDALLADVQRERDEYLELARRAKADFENYRKRAAKDAQTAELRGKATLARDLVPVLDNLGRALKAADEDSELARGVRLVLTELEETLERAGVEAYDPSGEPFDPSWHEALSTQPAEETESGIVIETLERGYRLDGQVLRPARVVVSQ